MVDDILEKGHIGLDPAHSKLSQGSIHPLAGFLGVPSPGRGLRQQGIVVGNQDRPPRDCAPIQSQAESCRRPVGGDLPEVRRKLVFRVLCRNTALQGATVERNFLLLGQRDQGIVQPVALGNQNLRAHQVYPRHPLGHGVLDLDSGIDLDEVPFPTVHIQKELDRSGIHVADFTGQNNRCIAQLPPKLFRYPGGRRHLHHLLMSSLHRTVPFIEVHDLSMLVGQDLNLHMLGPLDEAFQEKGAVAEGCVRLTSGFGQLLFQILGGTDDPHSPSAAAEGCLGNQGKPQLSGRLPGRLPFPHGLVRSGNHGDSRLLGQAAGSQLVPKQFQKMGGGPHEGDVFAPTSPGELGILGQKSVPRMDGLHLLVPGDRQNALDVQIGLHRPLLSWQGVGLIGLETVQGDAVRLGVDGDRPQPEFGGRPHDTNGDFAAVGSQEFLHRLPETTEKRVIHEGPRRTTKGH